MEPESNDWMYDTQPGVDAPSPRIMSKGPDAMRPGQGGSGHAFIFFPDGHLEWSPDVGHEHMFQNPQQIMSLLQHAFNTEEIKRIGEKTSYQGQPFFENFQVRLMLQGRALFGRVGMISGYELLALWPGTENLPQLLPNLIDRLLHEDKINGSTLITMGREARYTVDYFLSKKKK